MSAEAAVVVDDDAVASEAFALVGYAIGVFVTGEAIGLMGSITERFVLRAPTTAQGDITRHFVLCSICIADKDGRLVHRYGPFGSGLIVC
jgi:hypothetical protein